MEAYRDLIVWQKSLCLVEEIYRLVKLLPKEEQYALSDQMRRAAVSIPSNIAEGQARRSGRNFIHFLTIAKGSKFELETQLIICERLNYLDKDLTQPVLLLCDEIGRMLNALISKLKSNP